MAKRIYIAATRQNEGKTMVSLGLIAALRGRGLEVGFIKPVGQRYVQVGDFMVDEDSYLMNEVFKLEASLEDMSPVVVGRGFTAEYIDNPTILPLWERIRKSYAAVSKGKEVVVIEGTGHAGVGSVFDLGNAVVANFLEAKALLISCGGIGRPIDELVLNQALFEKHGVEIAGVIINKVQAERLEKIRDYAQRGLARLGMSLLGVIPQRKALSNATVRQIRDEMKAELVGGEAGLDETVQSIVVGAMTPHRAMDHFTRRTLVITPGDREDIILAAMSSCAAGIGKAYCVSGICLTGGLRPHKTVLRLIRRTDIPVMVVPEDTYTAASKISDFVVKIRPTDQEKIRIAARLTREYLDLDSLLNRLA
jgi:hypothetical protein